MLCPLWLGALRVRRRTGRRLLAGLAGLALLGLGTGCDQGTERITPPSSHTGASGHAGTGASAGTSGHGGTSGEAGNSGTAGIAVGGRGGQGAGAGGVAGADQGTPLPPDEGKALCRPYFEALCPRWSECSPFFFTNNQDVSSCIADRTADCEAQFDEPTPPVRTTTDRDCVDHFADATCGEVSSWVFLHIHSRASCLYERAGLPAGAPCNRDESCESGNCLLDTPHCGKCTPLGQAGDPCWTYSWYSYGLCSPGYLCSNFGACEQAVKEGLSCSEGRLCDAGLQWNGKSCEPMASLGQSCTNQSNDPCNQGAGEYCNVQLHACQQIETAAQGVGADCGAPEGLPLWCQGGLLCRTVNAAKNLGSCQPAPAEGEPCDPTQVLYGTQLYPWPACAKDNLRCIDGICQRYATFNPALCP
jgi:hypothetical protein